MNTPKNQAYQLLQGSLVHIRKACKNGLGVIKLEELIKLHRANRWKEALQEYREHFQKEAAVSVPFALLFAKGYLSLFR